jgi:hypothetical protein
MFGCGVFCTHTERLDRWPTAGRFRVHTIGDGPVVSAAATVRVTHRTENCEHRSRPSRGTTRRRAGPPGRPADGASGRRARHRSGPAGPGPARGHVDGAGHAEPVHGGHGELAGAQRRGRPGPGGLDDEPRRRRLAADPRVAVPAHGRRPAHADHRPRARQPHAVRHRQQPELHGLQAQRPGLRVPGREPGDLGLHRGLDRPGPAHVLPGPEHGEGHAPASPADRRHARRALQGQHRGPDGHGPEPRRQPQGHARLLAHRPDGPLPRRRRRHELHRLQPHAAGPRPPLRPARRDRARPGRLRAPRALRPAVHGGPRHVRRRRLEHAGRPLLRAQPVHRARRPVPAHPRRHPGREPQLVQLRVVRRRRGQLQRRPRLRRRHADEHPHERRHEHRPARLQPRDERHRREPRRHLHPEQPRLGHPRADGRPGEGRPRGHGVVLPALRRRRGRVRPVHDG